MASMAKYKAVSYLILVCGVGLAGQPVFGVSPSRYNELTRDEFYRLDQDATEVYKTNFDELDFSSNVTYDNQLFRLLRAYKNTVMLHSFDYKYTNQSYMEQSRGPKVNRELCKQQLNTLVVIAREAQKMPPQDYGNQANNLSIPFSAINFLETYGRSEAALLQGNSVWLGSYSNCIQAKIPAKSAQLFSQTDDDILGRYCVAHLKARSWPKWDIYYEDRISIKVGVCLPESCHSLDHSQDEAIRADVDYLARVNLLKPFNSDRYFIDHLYCLPDEDSPFRQLELGAILFLVFCFIWVVLLTYANIRYGQRMRQMREQNSAIGLNGDTTTSGEKSARVESTGFDFVKAFSVVANLESLCKTNINNIPPNKVESKQIPPNQSMLLVNIGSNDKNQTKDIQLQATKEVTKNVPKFARVNLDIMDGFKFGCAFVVVMGHTLLQSFGVYQDLRNFDSKALDMTFLIYLNYLAIISIFYIITGILIGYFAFNKPKDIMQPSYWVRLIVFRYVRLIPLYILVFWFAKHVAAYTGSGGTWPDYRTDDASARSYCTNESWLSPFTFSASDLKIPLGCVPQAWYLSTDFRCILILPFYVVLMSRNKTYGYAAIFLTCFACLWKQMDLLKAVNLDWSPTIVHFQAQSVPVLIDRTHDFYTSTFTRLSTCLMGVVCGHLLYLYKSRQIDDWPRWFRSFGLMLALNPIIFGVVGTSVIAHSSISNYVPDIKSNWVPVIIPALKTLMDLCFCVIMILMMTGGGFKTLNKFLSSRVMKFLATISYAVFMVHIEVIYKFPSTEMENFYWSVISRGIFFNVVSNVVAFFIHILYEMPINNFTRHYLK